MKMKKILSFVLISLVICMASNVSAAKKKSKYRTKVKKKYRYDVIVINRKYESRKKADMHPVLFTHSDHAERYKCKTCHPKIFIPRKGANDMNMQKFTVGKFCGACHNGRAAWSLLYCDNCHSGDPVNDENALQFIE